MPVCIYPRSKPSKFACTLQRLSSSLRLFSGRTDRSRLKSSPSHCDLKDWHRSGIGWEAGAVPYSAGELVVVGLLFFPPPSHIFPCCPSSLLCSSRLTAPQLPSYTSHRSVLQSSSASTLWLIDVGLGYLEPHQ